VENVLVVGVDSAIFLWKSMWLRLSRQLFEEEEKRCVLSPIVGLVEAENIPGISNFEILAS
jgi:hypothetical protein